MVRLPKPNTQPSRRMFCAGSVALLLAPPLTRTQWLFAQAIPANALRPDVAAIDHDRILAAAQKYLSVAPTPLTTLACPRSPGTPHDYYSEAIDETSEPTAPDSTPSTNLAPFTGHRDALFALGQIVPALAAAHLLTRDARFVEHAVLHLRAWFVDPATSMNPSLEYGSVVIKAAPPATVADSGTGAAAFGTTAAKVAAEAQIGRPEGIIETLPLAELAQAIPFLAVSPALSGTDSQAIHAWFAAYLHWLTDPQDSGPRLAAQARDRKDHHASSWLLQAAAYSRLTAAPGAPSSETSIATELRHRFRTVTLRAQILANGTFPHELTTSNPYRNSLFNLDMLAAVCELLSTRFDSVWEYELQDGPGMRSVIAFHFPFIESRNKWPYLADIAHFKELPSRRPSLLFAARAYSRPEYATLWKTLPPDPTDLDILRTIPIHQPLLWVRQPPRPA
jgi:Alginate lyase